MALAWQRKEMMIVHEDSDFIVQLTDENKLVFWEQIDTRYIGPSDPEIMAAHVKEIHPTEDTLITQSPLGYACIYRPFMKVEVLGRHVSAFLQAILPAA